MDNYKDFHMIFIPKNMLRKKSLITYIIQEEVEDFFLYLTIKGLINSGYSHFSYYMNNFLILYLTPHAAAAQRSIPILLSLPAFLSHFISVK